MKSRPFEQYFEGELEQPATVIAGRVGRSRPLLRPRTSTCSWPGFGRSSRSNHLNERKLAGSDTSAPSASSTSARIAPEPMPAPYLWRVIISW